MTPLFPTQAFSEIFEEFKDKKVAYIPNPGNVGDTLIDAATRQLFHRYEINYRVGVTSPLSLNTSVLNWADEIAYGGGGSLGSHYYSIYHLRQSLFQFQRPITILPQSIVHLGNTSLTFEKGHYRRIWVRERKSLESIQNARIAPDLALAFQLPEDQDFHLPDAIFPVGIFLRKDEESVPLDFKRSLGDPYQICQTLKELFQLVSQFETIYTNRLHFAIAGLITQRNVHLLPNAYYKNQAVYEYWLKNLGCQWNSQLPNTLGAV